MPAFKPATSKTTPALLRKIAKDIEDGDTETKQLWASLVNEWLNDLLGQDFFGTEGQCDPRGDHRE